MTSLWKTPLESSVEKCATLCGQGKACGLVVHCRGVKLTGGQHMILLWQCLSLKLSGRLPSTISFFLETLLVPKSMSRLRADIQALRAIAVLLVIAYHVSPTCVTGGFIGVDVFSVISGYLITGQLVCEVNTTGRIDFPDFYARRAQRLLPASSLTLMAVGLASYVWMPPSTWATMAADMAASSLYVQNWMLVRRSVDYLAQGQMPSPLQHFWSLSVEEQFYFI